MRIIGEGLQHTLSIINSESEYVYLCNLITSTKNNTETSHSVRDCPSPRALRKNSHIKFLFHLAIRSAQLLCVAHRRSVFMLFLSFVNHSWMIHALVSIMSVYTPKLICPSTQQKLRWEKKRRRKEDEERVDIFTIESAQVLVLFFIFSPRLFHSQYFFMIISLNIFPTRFQFAFFFFSSLMTHHECLKPTRDFYKHIKVGRAIGCRMECECGHSQTLRSISSRFNSISIIQFSLCRRNSNDTHDLSP